MCRTSYLKGKVRFMISKSKRRRAKNIFVRTEVFPQWHVRKETYRLKQSLTFCSQLFHLST